MFIIKLCININGIMKKIEKSSISRILRIGTWFYNLTGLEYANTVYDVCIYLKSSTALRPDRWSRFSVVTFRTSPKLPGAAPQTDIGSFEIAENNGSRHIVLILHIPCMKSYRQQ